MSEETKLRGPAFTPAQHIEAFYYVPDLIKRELPPEAVFSLRRVKLYILLIYTIYSSAESFIVCTERLLTEEGEHEDAVIPYSQLVGVLKVISGHEVVLLDGERGETEKVGTAAACRHWCAFQFVLKSCARMRRTTTLPATSGTVASSLLLSASS